jgi:hypothetical protein
MGIGSDLIQALHQLKTSDELPPERSVMEIGAQQLAHSFLSSSGELERLAALFGVTRPFPLGTADEKREMAHGTLEHLASDAPPAQVFWEWLGYRYGSIDVDTRFNSIPLDLNFDSVPASAKKRYALVTNYGTTEHVANQLNAFKVIHDLTMLGGLMFHRLPAQGMFNHGLVNYNPKFFWMLCRSNGYSVVNFEFASDTTAYPLPQNIIDFVGRYTPSASKRLANYRVRDSCLMVVLRKVYDIEFVAPIDVPTGTESAGPEWTQRYWTVFTPDAFCNFPSTKGQIRMRSLLRRFSRIIRGRSASRA